MGYDGVERIIEHPWQSARDYFMRSVMPRLREHSAAIGGDTTNPDAIEIVKLYKLLAASFDPVTSWRVEEVLNKWEKERNMNS